MKIAKRIFLFVTVNILIVATLSIVLSVLGVKPYLNANGINYESLIIFCLVWGFGGAFISLALSRIMAKWMMGVRIVDPSNPSQELQSLVRRTHRLAREAGINKMPEVGYYESDDINAFATGPTRNRSLVAVSTGLLRRMSETEVDGVLAHEIAHIANGDMVTMTLVQGIVNAFVMFLARVAGFFASQAVDEEKRPMVQMITVFALEILLGFLGMIVVASFSRRREYRADAGGAALAGKASMVAALKRLQQVQQELQQGLNAQQDQPARNEHPALASLKISGRPGRFLNLFSTHPALEDRIQRLISASSIR